VPGGISNKGPFGSTLAAALASNQLIEPQSEVLSGVIQHAWVGAKDWHIT